MRFNPCAKLEADVVEGKQCPGDIVVFGPYVNVPGNADVKISFDVESPMKLTASSDVVSQVGKIFHAGIDDEAIEPGPRRHLQYRVRVAQPTTALEARITLRGEGRSNFKIFNFSLAVQ